MIQNQISTASAVQVPGSEPEAKKGSRKAAKKNDIDVILTAFRRLYDKQLSRTISTKKEALSAAFSKKSSATYSYAMFEQDIAKRVDILLSNAYFMADCSTLGIDSYIAATHFVLEGYQTISDYVLRRSEITVSPSSEWSQAMFDFDRMNFCVPHIGTMVYRREKSPIALPGGNTMVAA